MLKGLGEDWIPGYTRTAGRDDLAAARARGVRLGSPNGAAALRRAGKGAAALRAAVAANADAFAQDLVPLVAELRREGHTTLRAIAAKMNARGTRTRRGGRWHVSTVRNLLERLEQGRGRSPGRS